MIKPWQPWSDEDRRFLALALGGEVGELQNVIKKAWRGDDDPTYEGKLAEEMADARIYLELLALAHGMDLDAACVEIVRSKLRARWPEAASVIDRAFDAAGTAPEDREPEDREDRKSEDREERAPEWNHLT
ncbi:MAG: hypothetical protein ACRDHY_13960 [Anaerolineales bacterium]